MSATRRKNDRNMWRANSYFLRGNIFFLLLRLRNSFFCFFFIQSQAFESFECSSFSYCNNLVKPWNYVIASSSYVFLRHSYDYHLALFWASSITHKKKTFTRIQFTQETNSTSKSYIIVLQTSLFTMNVIWVGNCYIRPWLRAIDYTREKDCNRMTLLDFLTLIFKIIKIKFRIFFYLRFDSSKRKNLNIMA